MTEPDIPEFQERVEDAKKRSVEETIKAYDTLNEALTQNNADLRKSNNLLLEQIDMQKNEINYVRQQVALRDTTITRFITIVENLSARKRR